jgi:hypothetical protein
VPRYTYGFAGYSAVRGVVLSTSQEKGLGPTASFYCGVDLLGEFAAGTYAADIAVMNARLSVPQIHTTCRVGYSPPGVWTKPNRTKKKGEFIQDINLFAANCNSTSRIGQLSSV